MKKFKVYEMIVKVYLLKNLTYKDSLEKITDLVNYSFNHDEKMVDFHKADKFKLYCHDNLYPIPENDIYEKDKIYQFRIRTVDRNLIKYFHKHMILTNTDYFKTLNVNIRSIRRNFIDKIFSLTPTMIHSDDGYVENGLSQYKYRQQLLVNLAKKYAQYYGNEDTELVEFFQSLEIKTSSPVPVNYKGVTLLGDKITMDIKPDEKSQEMAYFSLGTGILENNSLGCGFMGYKLVR